MNVEVKDEIGLIYLRARYCYPNIARFIQIDNNYTGEKEQVNTQNQYAYILNNPYKYVDRDGNAAGVATIGVAGLVANSQTPTKGWMLLQSIAKILNQIACKVNDLNKKTASRYHADAILIESTKAPIK